MKTYSSTCATSTQSPAVGLSFNGIFTSAYKGYPAACHQCGLELGVRTVQNAVKHAVVCDPEATESEMQRYKFARKSCATTFGYLDNYDGL